MATLTAAEILPSASECGICRDRLEGELSTLLGRSISLARGILDIDADPQKLDTVRSLGRRLAAAHDHLFWSVEGMDCAACAKSIETAVGGIPGVTGAQVGFNAQRLLVEFAAGQEAPERTEKAVTGLGYRVRRLAPAESGGAPITSEDAAGCGHDHDGDHDHKHGHKHGDHGHAHEQGDAHGHGHDDGTAPVAGGWIALMLHPRNTFTIVSGLLIALAFALTWASPELSRATFLAGAGIAIFPIARKGLRLLRAGVPFSIELLVTIAAVGAVFIDAIEEAAVVAFLFTVGEMLEGVAAGRARASIQALASLMPKTAFLVDGDKVREVPAEQVSIGDVIEVRPGGRIVADGVIVTGTARVDTSPVTGESLPVEAGPGDRVYAGTIATDATLRIRSDKKAKDNTIARIIQLVEQAEASRAPVARMVDRFSRIYTPIVIVVSIATIVIPPLAFGMPWLEAIYRGLTLLLIACPCALVISTPAAITSALSAGARHGLLIKGGGALETLGRARIVAFDKTGTLTAGRFVVTDVVEGAAPVAEVLGVAAAVESSSSHPLAAAILAKAKTDGVSVSASTDHKAVPGKGATAKVAGRMASVGSPRYAAELRADIGHLSPRVDALEAEGKTVIVVIRDGLALGAVALRDEPRPDARAAIDGLKRLGLRPVMLTGDNARTGAAVAADLGLEVLSQLLPEDKLKEIERLRAEGIVIMVGDGINDAPALAKADVGIAMGKGADVALETADAALLKDRVSGVEEMVRLSRAALANIRQNVTVAIGLKLIFLATTIFGVTGLWMAVLSDTGGTVLVTINALRLLRFGRSPQ